jgi:Lar family restriction alleviation protein
MTELRACPFCGDNKQLETWFDNEIETFNIWCTFCGADGPPQSNEASAIAAWNRRADDWQDIATAPKDGTEVLAWNSGGYRMLHWSDSSWPGPDWINEDGVPCHASHWRPLPKGPGG